MVHLSTSVPAPCKQYRHVHRGMFSAYILLCAALLHLLDASKVSSACSLPFQERCQCAPAFVREGCKPCKGLRQ